MEDDSDNFNSSASETGDGSANDSVDQSSPGVGYKRPPINTRFRKGESGNPKGRSRGRRSTRALYEQLMRETVRVTAGDKAQRISTSDALTQVLLRAAMKGVQGAVNIIMYIEDKAGLLKPQTDGDSKKHGYLVVPMKLTPEEWNKYALRALERNSNRERESQSRLPKVTRSLTGEITVHPLE